MTAAHPLNSEFVGTNPEPRDHEEQYDARLRQYLTDRSEAARGKAYELGRLFLADGISLIELSAIHHAALCEILKAGARESATDDLARAAEFLSECLSPYEMAHRGFQEAVDALRRMNQVLEQEIKRVAYAVHDEAGQLLVALQLLQKLLPGQHRVEGGVRRVQSPWSAG